MKKILLTAAIAASFTGVTAVNAAGTPIVKKTVSHSAKVKVSKPIKDLAPLPKVTKQRKTKLAASGEGIPGETIVKEVPNHFPFASKLKTMQAGQEYKDPALQSKITKKLDRSYAPTMGANFDGMTNPQGYVPPDTNGSVGPNHYVQTVNVSLAIWDKEGNQLVAPTAINALWNGFGGICETNNNGDPIVIYDKRADQWMISQFALNGTDNHQCIAVSQTGDPTGAYYLYDFPYGELMNDYPHFGIYGDAYYMGVNQFDPANGFAWAGGGVAAYERDKMLIGAPAQQVIISGQGFSPTVFTPMPLDVDGIFQPPEDMNQLFVWADGDGQSKLHVWEMDVDWSNPSAATFSAVAELDVAAFSFPNNATQPNGEELDALGIRSMFRTPYRNIDGAGKVLFTHNIAGPNGQPVARWYELDIDHNNGHAVSLNQQGTFSPDSDLAPSSAARWMASGAIDASGNIAIGYTVSGANNFPSIHAATRLATDPAGELTDEFVLVEGGGSQGAVNRGRWADYASMSIDPTDDCTFWYTNEYYKAENNGTLTWSTYISSFKIPSCTTGPSGQISGTVTDAESGDAVAYATVAAGNITATTDVNGMYTMVVPTGDYTISVSRYGWVSQTTDTITVEDDAELTNDFSLAAAEQVELTGTVTDGSGQGWPLYAKVSVAVPGDTLVTYTNPETGEYTLPLFAGTTVSVSVMAEGTIGYTANNVDVLPVADTLAPMSMDFSLVTDGSCTAPGYEFVDPAFAEKFEGDTFPPAGWTVTDDFGDGVVWERASESRLGNITGTEGDSAVIDSDLAGPSATADSSLISPVINVADITSTTLNFAGYWRTFTGADATDVDLNVDGAGWTTVQTLSEGAQTYSVDLSAQLAGATSFQIRFRYHNANWEYYASVDDIAFGEGVCQPVAGSLVSGYISDANTGSMLNGAYVYVDGEVVEMSSMTTDDDMLQDGFVNFFLPTAATSVSVMATDYETKEDLSASDFALANTVALNAGMLTADSDSLSASVTSGRETSASMTISNDGTADAMYQLVLVSGHEEAKAKLGPFHQSTRHMGPKDVNNVNAKKTRYFPDLSYIQPMQPGGYVGGFGAPSGYGIARNRQTGEFWNGEIAALGAAADAIRRYEANGAPTDDVIDAAYGGSFGADLAINQRTGMLWQVNVGGNNCIRELDPTTMMQTGDMICPDYGISQRGLAYDPISDTFFAGSWNDSMIHQFTTDGELLRSVNVGLPIAGLAYNPSTGHLFASLNSASSDGMFDIVIMDANGAEFVKVGGYDLQFDIDGDGDVEDVIADYSQAGLDIDCNGNLWMNDMDRGAVLGWESGETGVCDWSPSWLSADSMSGTIAIGADATINLAVANTLPAGTYYATVALLNDTPYGDQSIPVTIEVTEPNYGTYSIASADYTVKNGATATITVSRTDGNDFATTVNYRLIDGSAKAGVDYTVASGQLAWADMDSEDKTFTVETLNVDSDETKTLTVVIDEPSAGSLGDIQTSVLNITKDIVGVVGMVSSSVEVKEEFKQVTIQVARTDGSDRALTVSYASSDGTAKDGEDYTAVSGTLTWADGDSANKTITVTLNNDASEESDETFTVTISSDDPSIIGSNNTTTVVVTSEDDDGLFGGSTSLFILFTMMMVGLGRRRFK